MRQNKYFKRVASAILAASLVVTLMPSGGAKAASKGTVKSVKISNAGVDKTLVLKKGKTYTLKVKVTASGSVNKKVTFKSSKKSIVSVSASGKLKAKKNGKATITVTSKANKKKKATLNVVVGTPVTKVALDATEKSVTVGESFTLKATVSPKKASVTAVKFSTADKSVASVTSKGKVTAKKAGKVKITVAATDGSNKKAVCTVTVNNAEAAETVAPSASPSAMPSAAPSAMPSASPSALPSASASAVPSAVPTAAPVYLDKAGYKEKWSDDFNEAKLNRDDWNVELHEAGWVNSEQQEYVDSEDNIFIKDGSLILKPIKTTDAEGKTTYTSGRVNTQGKHDFKYGLFEAKVKVPKGQGYLPAFWMMPTDENLYGQWPKCGEIDGMEVMGQDTSKCYGTIHYGEPHKETQGTYVLADGTKDFSEDYHVFDVEWEPGKITWYVDGVKFHEANDWYSAVSGKGTKTYPAPFDQQFYMILNLAVGGSWVGMTDDTTDFENAEFAIDYVKAYQKDSYDENVTKPEAAEVALRDPDANGNYIVNGDFSTVEALDDEEGWVLMTADGYKGKAEAAIADNKLTVTMTEEGDLDYSVQAVQANIPIQKDASYTLSFDAKASEARQIKAAIKGPDQGWIAYLDDQVVDLTTKKDTYTFDFVVRENSDPNARLDFNMGAFGSTADVEISNVVLKKTGENLPEGPKAVLSNGNYIYNGEFDEGDARLGYWEISDTDKAYVTVTNEDNIRKLKVVAPEGTTEDKPVVVAQSDLGLKAAGKYAISFDAYKEGASEEDCLVVSFADKSFVEKLTDKEASYGEQFTLDSEIKQENADFSLKFTKPGTYYVDNVSVVEDALIKNGSFNAGLTGYEVYVSDNAKASYTIDSLKEDNAFAITINKSGDQDWNIQLYQIVGLEKGKFYRLQFDAKSSMERNITCVIQKNGGDYATYFNAIKAGLTDKYQTFSQDFEMKADTDNAAKFNFAMGKVDEEINTQHDIFIDNISLVEITEEEAKIEKVEDDTKAGENLLKNVEFAEDGKDWDVNVEEPGKATATFEDGKVTFKISDTGSSDSNIALRQEGLTLSKDAKYQLKFKASSTEERTINVALQDPVNYTWYGGDGSVKLTSELKEQTIDFTPANVSEDAVGGVRLNFALGIVTDWSTGSPVTTDTPASTIVISDISLVKVAE